MVFLSLREGLTGGKNWLDLSHIVILISLALDQNIQLAFIFTFYL